MDNKVYRLVAFVIVLTQLVNLAYLRRIDSEILTNDEIPPTTTRRKSLPSIPASSSSSILNSPTSTSSGTSSTKQDEDAIFYDISFTNNKKQTISVVQQQMNRIRDTSFRNVTIYYTMSGYKFDKEPGLNYQLIQYNKQNQNENNKFDLTIQTLYDYCQEHPTSIVSYIHNRGNRVQTSISTNATISEICRFMPSECNVCSTHFIGLPLWHTNANMWTASCNYVRKLIPPRFYGLARKSMFDTIYGNHTYFCLRPPIKDNYTGYNTELGLGRSSIESWIFTHPAVKPCDVFLHKWRDFMIQGELPPWNATLHVGPFHKILQGRPNAWQRLDGKLFELDHLYGKTPPTSSFFWKHYMYAKSGRSDGCKPKYRHRANSLSA